MSSYSRREFGKMVAAGIPLAALARRIPLMAAGSVTVGASTASFRALPQALGRDNVDDIIAALKLAGVKTIELSSVNFEPGMPDLGSSVKGGSAAYPSLVKRSPAEIAAIRARARQELRAWRNTTGADYFQNVRVKFAAAGIAIHSIAFDYTDAFSNDEVELTLKQAEALGVSVVSSPLTMAMAKQIVPVAAGHQIRIAVHNQVDGNKDELIGTAQLAELLALSPAFALKLDVGNLTASNCDAVEELRTHQSRVSHVLVQDRLRNGGAPQMFGEGDTPIAGVLSLLKGSSIPAFAEYGYFGLNSPADEVRHCVEFMQHAV